MEELDIGMKCIKYMLFVANFMFVMVGFLLFSIGATIKSIYSGFEIFLENHYFSPATLAIVIGCILFFVALFGCVGAIKESTLLINIFAICLSVILILEVAAAIAAYSMRNNVNYYIERNMNVSLQNYNQNNYERKTWKYMQESLHCCGVHDPTDWSKILLVFEPNDDYVIHFPTHESNLTIPKSCCRHDRYNQNVDQCKELWGNGCLDNLSYIISECALLLGCGAVAVAFIQVLGIIFSHLLAKTVRKLKTQQLVERQRKREEFYEQLEKRAPLDSPQPVIYTNYSPDYTEA